MATKNLGTIPCPLCDNPAHIRRMESRKAAREGSPAGRQGGHVGRLYVYCDDCGAILANKAGGQGYIAKKGLLFDGEMPAPKPEPADEKPAAESRKAEPAAKPEPEPKPAAKKRPDLWEW